MQGVDIFNLRTPFPGLRSFEKDDKSYYFGRERQLDELLRKLRSNRFLAVVGGNGTGKSSFIKASLIPRLEEGFTGQRGNEWNTLVCKPGNNPIENLSRSLAEVLNGDEMMDSNYPSKVEGMLRAGSLGLVEAFKKSPSSKENLLLVVDQFEEVFPFSKKNRRNEEDAATFINLLLNASRQKDVPIYILITMRSGFIGACSDFRGLAEAINDGQFLVPRIKPEDLKRIILNPISNERAVKEVGAEVQMDSQVAQALVDDLGKNTDELGTLQHALLRMWNHWVDTEADLEVPINMKHYKSIGTLKGALGKHAEEAYADLDTEEKQIICERMFRAMVEKTGQGEYESRSVTVKEIMDITGRSMREVRLVVYTFSQNGRGFVHAPPVAEIDEDTVISIAHDSLIKRWMRLREWASDEAESAEMYARLCEAAILHTDGKGSLWVDPELGIGLKWFDPQEHDPENSWKLPPNQNWAKRYEHSNIEYEKAIEFLVASHNAQLVAVEREEENEERKTKKRKAFSWGALFIILFCLGLVIWALWSAREAHESARIASRAEMEARRQTYLAELSKQEAGRQKFYAELNERKARQQTEQAEKASMTAIEATRIAEQRAKQAANSERLAKQKEQEALRAKEDALRQKEAADAAKALAEKKKREAEEQREIALRIKGLSLAQSIAVKSWKEEDEDIQGLLAKEAYDLNAANLGKPDDPFVYEAVYRALDRLNDINNAYPNFNALDQAPEGRNRIGRIRGIEVSPDNSTIYSVGSDGLLLKWKFELYGSKAGRKSKQNKPEIISSNIAVSRAMDISPDGAQLVRAGDNSKIIVSDAQTGELVQEVDANQGRRIWDVKYTPNGVGLVCTGDDGTGGTSIQYANLSGGASPIIGKTPHRITRIDISSEGKYIAGTGNSSEVWIWNIQNQRREFKLDNPNSDKLATAVSFNPQGRFAAVGYQDGTVMLWDLNKVNVNKNYRPEKFLFHGAKISDIDFSPDGTKLVVGSLDGTASLWTVRNNDFKGYDDDQEFPYLNPKFQPIKFDKHDDWVTSVRFSNDGSRVVTGTNSGHLRIWETDMTLYADQICEIIRQNLSDKSWRKYIGTDDPKEQELFIYTIDGGRRIPFSTCGEKVPQMKEEVVLDEDLD